jgi:predicted membrane protein
VLGGVERTCGSQDFRGGELTAFMGGCVVDLRKADMKVGEAVIQTFAFWGGIEIKVPEDWTVSLQAFPILGGFDEKTQAPREGPRKVLVIKGFAIMGGVEVRN